MAKATRKTAGRKAASPKPAGHKMNGRMKAAKPSSIDTREGLIAEMGALLDRVDAALPGMQFVNWNAAWGALAKLRAEESALEDRMWELLDRDENVTPADIFGPALETPGGTVPTLARAGTWLEWISYVPVVVYWSGFLGTDSSFSIADPAEKWITPSGYRTAYFRVDNGDADLRALARDELTGLSREKSFDLHEVSEAGRNSAIERLAASEWLRLALDKGPVDPIPLPAKLKAVQQMLFV